MGPPERIAVDTGILLRRLKPEDGAAAHRAVVESFESLHAWMPWAAEPPKPGAQEEFAALSDRQWDNGEAYVYAIFDLADEERLIGTVGLHARVGPGAFDIGYWLHTAHTGRGVATRAAAAVSEAGLALPGIERVEIHCDVANSASAAIPKRLGFRLDRIVDHPPDAPAETGRRMIWVKHRA